MGKGKNATTAKRSRAPAKGGSKNKKRKNADEQDEDSSGGDANAANINRPAPAPPVKPAATSAAGGLEVPDVVEEPTAEQLAQLGVNLRSHIDQQTSPPPPPPSAPPKPAAPAIPKQAALVDAGQAEGQPGQAHEHIPPPPQALGNHKPAAAPPAYRTNDAVLFPGVAPEFRVGVPFTPKRDHRASQVLVAPLEVCSSRVVSRH
jgi:hypothetical protein